MSLSLSVPCPTSASDVIAQATLALLPRATGPANPSTPVLLDDVQWITAYLVIHMMSPNSRRYMFYLWMIVALITFVAAAFHWLGTGNGAIGAYWNKWAWRRRTWRGQHALKLSRKRNQRVYPTSLPSNGQLLCLVVMFAVTAVLSVIGPDYISPASPLLGIKRDSILSALRERASADTSQYVGFQPNYTIPRAWWTAGGRAGLIAFALIPLCILFALKAPPFALFSLPFAAQYHFDKLAWLHRWSGRLIWLMTALHVAFWSVQLARDHRSTTQKSAYTYAWQYTKFLYGWTAFGLFTLLLACSSLPIRRHYYEAFYFLHVLLVPLTLITSALHHPPVGIWCWAALGIWGTERAWRALRWLYLNGIFTGRVASPVKLSNPARISPFPFTYNSRGSDYNPISYPPLLPQSVAISSPRFSANKFAVTYHPPYGYTLAELQSGATIRLTFVAPSNVSWASGQNFLITIPSVSAVTSHPFTVASACDEESNVRVMIFLIRAKSGWTRDLWDHITSLLCRNLDRNPADGLPINTPVPHGSVLLRMWIDGPFGSAVRARWERHSTVLIIVGGTGVSFGTSILEYVSMCLSGRDGKKLGGRRALFGVGRCSMRRIRFVWLVREFSHIQWCASIIRRCLTILPPDALKVDIFVTSFVPQPPRPPQQFAPPTDDRADGDINPANQLEPPKPLYINHRRSSSVSSCESDSSDLDGLVDLSYYTGDFGDEEEDPADMTDVQRDYTLELTNFDGDEETALPGEDEFSRRVRLAGKKYRATNRKKARALAAKDDLDTASYIRRSRDGRRESSRSTDFLLRTSIQHGHERSDSESTNEIDLSSAPMIIDNTFSSSLPHRDNIHPSSASTLRLVTASGAMTPASRPPSPIRSPLPHFANTLSSPTMIPPFTPLSPRSSSTFLRKHPVDGPVVGKAPSVMADNMDAASEAHSAYFMTATASDGNQTRLEIKKQDVLDVEFISKNARGGKPVLDRILQDELAIAGGSVVVACCGPSSLNAKVRKTIATHLRPGKNNIDLVSEDFAY